MDGFWKDLVQAVQALFRRPGPSALAITTLALGIGAVVAVFTVVEAILVQPLPFQEPDRLVNIAHVTREGGPFLIPRGDVHLMKERGTLFSDIAVRSVGVQWATIKSGGEFQRVRSLYVGQNYLGTLGAAPALGRLFIEDDAHRIPGPGEEAEMRPPAVVVTHGFWQRFLGGDPEAVGGLVEMDSGWKVEVVGVLRPDFRLLHSPRNRWERWSKAELFIPYPAWDLQPTNYAEPLRRNALMIGRLRQGVTYPQAQEQLNAIAAGLREESSEYARGELRIVSTPLHELLVADSRPVLLVLAGAVSFLLLLVCANVANLLLALARSRRTEAALRKALGCSRARLFRGFVFENLLLAVGGSLVGVALGWAMVRALSALRPADVPLLDRIAMHPTAVAVAVGAALVTALVAGIFPSLLSTRVQLASVLKEDTPEAMGPGPKGFMNGLVVLEVTLSTVLLAGALLMVRTLASIRSADPGFDSQGVLVASVDPIPREYWDQGPSGPIRFRRTVAERIKGLPGVEAVGFGSMPPHMQRIWNGNYGTDDASLDRAEFRADFRVVAGDYFRALGTRVIQGRDFTPAEMAESSQSVIVDEFLARQTWPDQNPLGRHLVIGDARVPGTVVGVVESMQMGSIRAPARGAIYFPQGTLPRRGMMMVVRSSGDPGGLVSPIRATLSEIHPDLLLYEVAPLASLHARSMASTRFVLAIMGFFAVVSLAVASVGLFGVLANTVRRRTAEIGLRMALGAKRSEILSLVVGHSLRLSFVGILIGIGAALALGDFMAGLVFGVSARDPLTLAVVAVLFGMVATLASYGPARRATRVEPIKALRAL